MANLDEISMILGEIKADMRHAVKWFDEHEQRDQERFEELAARIEAGNHVKTRVQQIERDVQAAKPILEGITRAKWVVIGFVIAIGTLGGAIGGFAASVFKVLV